MSSQLEIVTAVVDLQLFHLTPAGQPLIDDPAAAAPEVLAYIATLPDAVQQVFHLAITHIDDLSAQRKGKNFGQLTRAERESVLDELWGDHLWHDLISMLAKVGWLVVYSREPARKQVGFILLQGPPPPLADVPQPPRPPLDVTYDVCVIGSGAGGAVVASRLAAKGKRVLMIDEGKWISPKNYPTRDDQALMQLYRNSGVQPALPALDHVLKPGGATFMTVLQARVIGGGPAINNAIHFPISETRAGEWSAQYDFPVAWNDLLTRLQQVRQDLGASASETELAAGERSRAFARGVHEALGVVAETLETVVLQCAGCGGCNVGCRFGLKTGGLHGPRPAGAPISYLERARAAGALICPELQARSFKHGLLGRKISALACRDLHANRDVDIKAKLFVLASGPLASSRLLRRSFIQVLSPVGRNISANIVMPVFALMPADLGGVPDPGLEMCYYVGQDGRLLESWFHYPGSLTTALGEWLAPHVRVMSQYRRLVACGVVVPSGNQGELGASGDLVLSPSDDELRRLVAGALSAADLFFAAGAAEVIPAAARPIYLRKPTAEADKRLFKQSIRGAADLTLGTAHPQGGNRIGRHASRSVVSPNFALYDFDNLLLADASLFPAGCNVNPQMTAMALAHLAADRALAALG